MLRPTIMFAAVVASLAAGCGKKGDMVHQPRANATSPSDFFDDRGSDRNLVSEVVPRGSTAVVRRPPLSAALLERGRESFGIYCSPCHGLAGYGNGLVVQRGYPKPTNYHIDRLRSTSDDYIYRVLMNGLGKMPPYRARVRHEEDRWAIIYYIRALQLSQNGRLEQVPGGEQRTLERARPEGGR